MTWWIHRSRTSPSAARGLISTQMSNLLVPMTTMVGPESRRMLDDSSLPSGSL